MNRSMVVWFAIAGLAASWGVFALGAGADALLPGLLAVVALGCAVDTGVRGRVMGGVLWALSGSGLRAVLIVLGAAMLWQLVGVELALLMAGDVLAYVEVLAAVSLMGARARFGPVKAALAVRVRRATNRLRAAPAALARSSRAARPARRRPPPASDVDGRAGGWALA
jgi:hypothetical protein